MRKIFIFCVFVNAFLGLTAQIPELSIWNNIRNSSITIDDSIHIRCEMIELPEIQTELFYFDGSQWQSTAMNQYLGLTYEGVIPAQYGVALNCRFRTEADTLVAMMPAYITNDVFPPSAAAMSLIAPDPIGDNLEPTYQNLDLTANYFGYSNSRFYGGFNSDTGTFPLNSGGVFPSTYFFYITLIINPENVLIDTVAYAMIHGNIPILFSSGLYRIHGTEFSLDTLVRIGDIETQVVGNQLITACNIQTLTSDEYFGDWPSISNSLIVEMATAVYSLPDVFLLADYSKFSLQFIDQYIIEPFVNILPVIDDIGFVINSGTSTVWFSYFDENGHFPLNCDLHVGGSIFQMLPIGFDYSQPVIFETTFPLTGWDEATISVSDNGYEFVEETFQNNTNITQNLIPDTQYLLSNYPNPFNPSTTISFSLTTEITGLLRQLPDTPRQAEDTEITIFNLKGQKVKVLGCCNSFAANARDSRSTCSVVWDGTDQNEQPVASGIYFYQLKIDNQPVAGSRMLLLK